MFMLQTSDRTRHQPLATFQVNRGQSLMGYGLQDLFQNQALVGFNMIWEILKENINAVCEEAKAWMSPDLATGQWTQTYLKIH